MQRAHIQKTRPLFCRAVLRFIERYEPDSSSPDELSKPVSSESGSMRDIPKWRSQKAVWVPFFVTLDMMVWETLKAVLEADSGRQLHFQKSTPVEVDDKPSTNQTAKQNSEETGRFKLCWCVEACAFPLHFIFLPDFICRHRRHGF